MRDRDTELNRQDILRWLREDDPDRLRRLWTAADDLRRDTVGEAVHLRGLVEMSNHCRRECAYCGLRAPNERVVRYRMDIDEIRAAARRAAELGFGTVVLQSGEDPATAPDWLEGLIRDIKEETGLAVTLSVGEQPAEYLQMWRQAGADRYLLRFETSDPELYARLHPDRPDGLDERLGQLPLMRDMGYEIGGGVMVGLPGQTYESLARDIELFREFDMDMVGLGPYIANPHTPLGSDEVAPPETDDQVPATERMTCKVLALTRLVCPEANIPGTTALATVDTEGGRKTALERGANVIMPNVTPREYIRHYRIYPSKSRARRSARPEPGWMQKRLLQIGRYASDGPGDRVRTGRGASDRSAGTAAAAPATAS